MWKTHLIFIIIYLIFYLLSFIEKIIFKKLFFLYIFILVIIFFFFLSFFQSNNQKNRIHDSIFMIRTSVSIKYKNPQIVSSKTQHKILEKDSQHSIIMSKQNKKLTKIHHNISCLINSKTGMRKRVSITNFKVNNQREKKNKMIAKRAFVQMEQKRKIEDDKIQEQNINILKNHINHSIKIHNKTIQNHQYILNTPKNHQRKKFLRNQLSFTEIDEEKIIAQKKILQQKHYINRSNGQITSIINNINRLSLNDQYLQITASKQILMQCFKTIDISFDVIEQLSKIGYNKRKNKYVLDYCKNCKHWMKNVYLQQSQDKKQNYTLNVKYLIVQNAQIAKQKLTKYLYKNNLLTINMDEILQDLEGLLQHIQQLLAQKKIMQIGNIGQFIESKLNTRKQLINDGSLKFNRTNKQIMKLNSDLAQIQAKFGKMKTISNVSRKKFQQLNRSYQKLISYA